MLLLDSLHPLSGLIQFAENRPVSHAAIYLGDKIFEFAHTTKHTRTQPAARKQRLRPRLQTTPGPFDRTVTALRHVDVISGHGTDGIIERVQDYIDPANTKYAYLNLVTLMAPSLLRSYDLYLSGGRVMSRTLEFLLQRAADTLLGLFGLTHRDAEFKLQKQKTTLTCSEFVYRCYTESRGGLEIEIVSPLEGWKSGSRAAGVRSAVVGGVAGLDLVELHPGITALLEPPVVRGSRAAVDTDLEATSQELATRTVEALGELMSHNFALSKYDQVETVRGVATMHTRARWYPAGLYPTS